MKKLNMGIIKKRMVALGLAAMMAVGMCMPAYARSVSDPGAVGWVYDASIIPTEAYYVEPTAWFGSYDVAIGGYEYQLVISPVPDEGPVRWMIEADRIPDGKGYSDASWIGWLYPETKYGLSEADDDGYIMQVSNWNGDKENPDVTLIIGYNPDIDEFFIRANPSTTHSVTNYKADANITGIPGEAAFPPQSNDANASTVAYKKVSNAYEALEPYPGDNGGTYWLGKGWTTNGSDRVEEPWWLPGTTSNGSGVG